MEQNGYNYIYGVNLICTSKCLSFQWHCFPFTFWYHIFPYRSLSMVTLNINSSRDIQYLLHVIFYGCNIILLAQLLSLDHNFIKKSKRGPIWITFVNISEFNLWKGIVSKGENELIGWDFSMKFWVFADWWWVIFFYQLVKLIS